MLVLLYRSDSQEFEALENWLRANNQPYTTRSLIKEPLTPEEFDRVDELAEGSSRRFLDITSQTYITLGIGPRLSQLSDEEIRDMLLRYPDLYVDPILWGDDFAVLGFDEEAWAKGLKIDTTIRAVSLRNVEINGVSDILKAAETYDIPLEKMRFFIGTDYKEPKAFGIYEKSDGEWVVYKNKDTGERAIRYSGKDEAYAAREIWAKLVSEVELRRRQKYGAYQPPAKQPNKKAELATKIAIGVVVGCITAGIVAAALDHTPRRGYYKRNDQVYYYQNSDWYYFNDYDWVIYDNDYSDDDWEDYYYGSSYDFGDSDYDFEYSDYYEPYSYDNDSDSDWDSYDSDWGSWDTGGTDWGSDW